LLLVHRVDAQLAIRASVDVAIRARRALMGYQVLSWGPDRPPPAHPWPSRSIVRRYATLSVVNGGYVERANAGSYRPRISNQSITARGSLASFEGRSTVARVPGDRGSC